MKSSLSAIFWILVVLFGCHDILPISKPKLVLTQDDFTLASNSTVTIDLASIIHPSEGNLRISLIRNTSSGITSIQDNLLEYTPFTDFIGNDTLILNASLASNPGEILLKDTLKFHVEKDNPAPTTNPNIQWLKSFGGTDSDVLISAIELNDNSIVYAGQTSSPAGGDILSNKGQLDLWLLKTSATGDKIWSKTFGGSLSDFGTGVHHAQNGGLMITGTTESIDGDIGVNGYGQRDIVIIKIDDDGNREWAKIIGGSKFDVAYKSTTTTDGGIALAGFTNSIDHDFKNISNKGDADALFIKLDGNGDIAFVKTFGTSGFDVFTCLTKTSDGGYAFGGYVRGGGIYGHYWIVKVDSQGNLLWQKTIAGNKDDYPNSVVEANDGSLYIGGRTISTDIVGYHEATDAFLVKMTGSGDVLWKKALGGSSDDEILSLFESNSKIYISGTTSSNDGDVTSNHGIADAWLVQVSASGIIDWQKTIGGSSYDGSNFIIKQKEGTILLIGNSASTDGDINKNKGVIDAFIMKLK
jgi:hypothetical protein